MEPMTAPTPVRPAPIMDVAPPPKPPQPVASSSSATIAQPPADPIKQASAPSRQTSPKQSPAPKAAAPKPVGPTLPALPIAFAVIFFAALTALAYYAYTKSN